MAHCVKPDRPILAALVLAVALAAALPREVVAECDPVSGSWASFRDAAPHAPTIVIGHVTELLDTSTAATSPGASPLDWKFRMKVDATLRGLADDFLTYNHGIFAPGSVCLAPLQVGLGDRLGLALRLPVEPDDSGVLAVAYLSRELSARYPIPPELAMVESDVRAIAGESMSRLPILLMGGLVLAFMVLTVFARPRSARGR